LFVTFKVCLLVLLMFFSLPFFGVKKSKHINNIMRFPYSPLQSSCLRHEIQKRVGFVVDATFLCCLPSNHVPSLKLFIAYHSFTERLPFVCIEKIRRTPLLSY